MNLVKMLGVAAMVATTSIGVTAHAAPTAAPSKVVTVGQVKAVTGLLAAMQAEKMMRTTAATSQYANDAQRAAVTAKVDKLPKEQVYARLAYPLAKVISAETAIEMTRFYSTPYGQQVVHKMYNSSAVVDMGGAKAIDAAEKKEMKRPEYVKAKKELEAADSAIRHETFVLLQALSKK